MYRSLKTISMIAITITTMGVMPSYGLQSRVSSNATTSFSNFPDSYSQKNQNISSTLLASSQCTSSLGQAISERANTAAYGSLSFYVSVGRYLPRWENASYEQRCNYVLRRICTYGGDISDLTSIVINDLGGTGGLKNAAENTREALAIIMASRQLIRGCGN